MVLRSIQVLSRYRQQRRFIQRPGALTQPFTLLAPEVSSTGGVYLVGYKQCISRYVAMVQRGPRVYRSFPTLVARTSGFINPSSRGPASLPAAPALSGTAALEGGGHGETLLQPVLRPAQNAGPHYFSVICLAFINGIPLIGVSSEEEEEEEEEEG